MWLLTFRRNLLCQSSGRSEPSGQVWKECRNWTLSGIVVYHIILKWVAQLHNCVVDPIRTLHAAFAVRLISSVLLVEAEHSSKTFVLIYHTTGGHTSEDPNFNHRSVRSVGILKLMKLLGVSVVHIRNSNQVPTECKARGYNSCPPVFKDSLCLQKCLRCPLGRKQTNNAKGK
jgi:hypothetical protein